MSNSGPKHHFAWARLNADGLFLGLLAIGSGLFDAINPNTLPIISAAPPQEVYAVWLRCAGYVSGGLLILYGLLTTNLYAEIVGRFTLIGAVTFQVWRRWAEFGFTEPTTLEAIVLLIIILFTTALRVSALLSKDGITFTLPPKKQEG